MSEHTANKPAETHGHAHDEHSHDEHHGSMLSHVKPYLVIGAALFVFTVITVALSYVDFDKMLNRKHMNIIIGLAVATFKVCLVGAWFMHLKQEGGTIWKPLGLTLFFCLCLFLLFMLAHSDPIPSTSFTHH